MATAVKMAPAVSRDLQAELEGAQQQLAAAQAAAEALASEEDAALTGDESFAAFIRKKTLGAREIERLTKTITSLEIEIDDELARAEMAAFEKKYATVQARNAELQERLVRFREEFAPRLLELIRDLAADEIAVDAINRIAPWGRGLTPADGAVRHRPSQQEQVIDEEIIFLWCDPAGKVLPQQPGATDVRGRDGSTGINLRKFKRVKKLAFRPASDAAPLWNSMVVPRLDMIDAPLFDGRQLHSPLHALQALSQERREHPRDVFEELIPVDPNGNPIPREPVIDLGPAFGLG